MTKLGQRFAVAWGNTSTWFAWADHVLTMSDHASSEPLKDVEEFVQMWQGQRLVFRTHGAAFHELEPWKLSQVSVIPRLTAVGHSSFNFECLLKNETLIATTRGTCVYLDKTLTKSTPLPSTVRNAIVDRLEKPNLIYDTLLNNARASLQEVSLKQNKDSIHIRDTDAAWNTRVRCSECDALGHVNNAKWALLVADALRMSPITSSVIGAKTPELLHLDYLKPAFPGDIIHASVALSLPSSGPLTAARVDLARSTTKNSAKKNDSSIANDEEEPEICVSAIVLMPTSYDI
mmetsp:Transcript_47/g.81  ORF Transcript_47/g.81 Transcript_47/m.81 type:complete len:290 (-) Transcript_47:51-920(-)|eukprot:CAMPEP_0197297704 /NCGR_PEP_ID=MMETSP0890-20130614/41769_1 /TAXON_ID=44058 ORGANISM="Aureoumbra lagunensis, Strain CCMP1510" /NCGR_SAMPLE_ID=MMETSP0890 /ASSEMBLY_ACC=CAM_ASM_000533 /LENGTH=289 /DNA_ID=CAMNT_0042775005 /DNA_START=130 /DNA_END=996 /DNA_ORIENTATION=+